MKTIIFDVGDVVTTGDFDITYRRLESHGVSSHKARKFFHNEDYLAFSRGEIGSKAFHEALVRHLGTQLTYDQVVEAHDIHMTGIDQEVVAVLDKLPIESIVFATDTNEWQTKKEKELIDLIAYTDRIFRSHEIGMLKIDPGCFPYIITCLGKNPSELFFIDNNPKKTKMAEKCGIQSHVFTTGAKLREWLMSKELL